MGEVGVHLEHELGPVREREREARQVGAAESLLALAVQHPHRLELLGEPVRDPAGAVRRAVVDDEDRVLEAGRLELGQRRPHEALDVLGLVVGGQDEPGAGQEARTLAGLCATPR